MISFLTPEQPGLGASHPWNCSSWPHSQRHARSGFLMERLNVCIAAKEIIINIDRGYLGKARHCRRATRVFRPVKVLIKVTNFDICSKNLADIGV